VGETIYAYEIFGRKREGKRPLGRPKPRWEGNIKIGLREIGWERANWIQRNQDRGRWRAFVSTVMNLHVP
jgi:hypothetical protein